MSQTKNNFANPFEAWSQSWGQNWGQNNAASTMEDMRDQANKNMQAATSIAQMWAESAQAMARRSAEVAQKNMQTFAQCSKDSMNCKSIEEAQKAQSSSWNKVSQECCSNAKEMTEMSNDLTRRVIDACDGMSQECMKNWESTAKKATPSSKK